MQLIFYKQELKKTKKGSDMETALPSTRANLQQ